MSQRFDRCKDKAVTGECTASVPGHFDSRMLPICQAPPVLEVRIYFSQDEVI